MCATSRDLTHRDVNFTTTNQELRILFSPYEYMRRFGSDSGITQVASTANHAIEFLLSTATYPSYQKLPDHICAWRSIWSLERLELDNRVSPTLLSCARPGTCAELFAEDPLFISTSLHQNPFFYQQKPRMLPKSSTQSIMPLFVTPFHLTRSDSVLGFPCIMPSIPCTSVGRGYPEYSSTTSARVCERVLHHSVSISSLAFGLDCFSYDLNIVCSVRLLFDILA